MKRYVDKEAIIAEIERIMNKQQEICKEDVAHGKKYPDPKNIEIIYQLQQFVKFIDTLEVKDPYEQCIQYASIEDGIKAHAETYSFNIESLLFNQLTKEQQALWRKEIEQACISGGYAGYELAKDPRYKENVEAKEVDLDKEIDEWCNKCISDYELEGWVGIAIQNVAKHFFELGLKAQQS